MPNRGLARGPVPSGIPLAGVFQPERPGLAARSHRQRCGQRNGHRTGRQAGEQNPAYRLSARFNGLLRFRRAYARQFTGAPPLTHCKQCVVGRRLQAIAVRPDPGIFSPRRKSVLVSIRIRVDRDGRIARTRASRIYGLAPFLLVWPIRR